MVKVKKTIIIEIISSLFILLFVYTAMMKFIEHDSFKVVLGESPLIGSMANALSWLLPVTEILTAILLFFPSVRIWGFISALFLMTIFTGYITYMLLFASSLPCSCGGVLAHMTWKEHMVFNVFFTILAAAGLRLTLRNKLFIAINRQS
jgi:Methylamine utilisation protein MauE